jgi:hypothetical protein
MKEAPKEGYYKEYLEEYNRYSSSKTLNLRQQDTVLIQLSVGLIAVMATLGEKILKANKPLGFVLIVLLALTLAQAVIGYWLSDRFYTKAMERINKNYDKQREISKGIDKIWQGKLNKFFNHTIFPTFGAALAIFVLLVINYISGLK